MFIFILLTSLVSLVSFADDVGFTETGNPEDMSTAVISTDVRASDINLTGTRGPNNYQALSLDALVGIKDGWSLTGSFFQSDSGVGLLDEKLISKSGRLGVDWELNPTWGFVAEIVARQDPYEVQSRGGALSVRSLISDFWKSKFATTITFKVEQQKYTQDLTLQGPRATYNIDREITQKLGAVTLDQELALWLSVFLSHTRYNYSDGVRKLSRLTARRRTSFGSRGATYGLPDFVNSAGLDLAPWDWISFHLSTAESKMLNNDSKIKTNSLGVSFYWETWQIDVDGSRSTYGSVSGNDNATQDYSSVSLAYTW